MDLLLNAFFEWVQTIFFTVSNRITLLILITTFLIHWYRSSSSRLPPGPWGVPIFGFIPFFGKKRPHKLLIDLCERYGNVISFYLGSVFTIILGDYKAIKEAFVCQGLVFTGVPTEHILKIRPNDKGLILSEGDVHMRQRQFVLSNLKDFGLGKSQLEILIMDEIKHFITEIKKFNKQPINFQNILGQSVANIVFLFLFGKKYDYLDAQFNHFQELILDANKILGAVTSKTFLPWTKYIPFFERATGYERAIQFRNEIDYFFDQNVKQSQEKYVDGNRSNYVDSFFTERNATEKRSGSECEYNNEELLGNLFFLYLAGSQTVSITVTWTLLYLLKYPNVLKRIQQEIDITIGCNREPCINDKIKMPYTEATIMEIQRHVTIVPLSLARSNIEKTTLFGYEIPKRSYIVANIYAVHHDKSLWGDPENFRPERFLDEQGQVRRPEYFIPFSVGKRNCIGEPLGKAELFLYITSLLQQFNFKLPENDTLSLDYDAGIGVFPRPHKICFIPR